MKFDAELRLLKVEAKSFARDTEFLKALILAFQAEK